MGLQINFEPHWHDPVADPNGLMTLGDEGRDIPGSQIDRILSFQGGCRRCFPQNFQASHFSFYFGYTFPSFVGLPTLVSWISGFARKHEVFIIQKPTFVALSPDFFRSISRYHPKNEKSSVSSLERWFQIIIIPQTCQRFLAWELFEKLATAMIS
jgi:hypothetical protein